MPRLIQFSPPRTGSTLIYNMIKLIAPDRTVVKSHSVQDRQPDEPIICTFRHPVDSIVSSIQRYGLTPNRKLVVDHISQLRDNGWDDVPKLLTDPNALLLRYEDFYQRHEFAASRISAFLKVSFDLTPAALAELSIEAVLARTQHMKSFADYDLETHWHGLHVSDRRGAPGSGRRLLDGEDVALIEREFENWMNQMGYPSEASTVRTVRQRHSDESGPRL